MKYFALILVFKTIEESNWNIEEAISKHKKWEKQLSVFMYFAYFILLAYQIVYISFHYSDLTSEGYVIFMAVSSYCSMGIEALTISVQVAIIFSKLKSHLNFYYERYWQFILLISVVAIFGIA